MARDTCRGSHRPVAGTVQRRKHGANRSFGPSFQLWFGPSGFLDGRAGGAYHHRCPVDHHSRVILLEVVPLLVLAALYLGVALALMPELVRRRERFSWLGFGIWLVFVLVGALAAAVGLAKLSDDTFVGDASPWLVLGLIVFAYLPAAIFIWRWPERHLLVSAGPRVVEAEREALDRRRDAESISRSEERRVGKEC